MNENIYILIKISVKFVSKEPINTILALVQIMAWRRSGDKPLSEPVIVYQRTYVSLSLNELNPLTDGSPFLRALWDMSGPDHAHELRRHDGHLTSL